MRWREGFVLPDRSRFIKKKKKMEDFVEENGITRNKYDMCAYDMRNRSMVDMSPKRINHLYLFHPFPFLFTVNFAKRYKLQAMLLVHSLFSCSFFFLFNIVSKIDYYDNIWKMNEWQSSNILPIEVIWIT